MIERKNRLEVISESPNGQKITIVIESDMVPPIAMLGDMLKLFTKGDLN